MTLTSAVLIDTKCISAVRRVVAASCRLRRQVMLAARLSTIEHLYKQFEKEPSQIECNGSIFGLRNVVEEQTRKKLLIATVSSNALSRGLHVSANAREGNDFAQARERQRLDTVVVTATKREQSPQDVPIRVSVLPEHEIDNKFSNNIESLNTLVPSIRFRKQPEPDSSGMSSRGIGTCSFSLTENLVLLPLRNDVVSGYSVQVFTRPYDIERVEVLHEPQDILCCKNAQASMLKIVNKEPDDKFNTFIEDAVFEESKWKVYSKSGGTNFIFDTFGAGLTLTKSAFDDRTPNLRNDEQVIEYARAGLSGMAVYKPTSSETKLRLINKHLHAVCNHYTDKKTRTNIEHDSVTNADLQSSPMQIGAVSSQLSLALESVRRWLLAAHRSAYRIRRSNQGTGGKFGSLSRQLKSCEWSELTLDDESFISVPIASDVYRDYTAYCSFGRSYSRIGVHCSYARETLLAQARLTVKLNAEFSKFAMSKRLVNFVFNSSPNIISSIVGIISSLKHGVISISNKHSITLVHFGQNYGTAQIHLSSSAPVNLSIAISAILQSLERCNVRQFKYGRASSRMRRVFYV